LPLKLICKPPLIRRIERLILLMYELHRSGKAFMMPPMQLRAAQPRMIMAMSEGIWMCLISGCSRYPLNGANFGKVKPKKSPIKMPAAAERKTTITKAPS
jgi:hypothetical protein